MPHEHRSGLRGSVILPLVLVAAAVVAAGTPEVLGHPKPAPVPYRWELVFEPGDLRLYIDPPTGDAYWFMTYKVTNRTGKGQLWAPAFTLFTDEGEILRSGDDVPSRVSDELLALLGSDLIEEQNAIIGNILHGREHAKEGLVVWPARNLTVNELTVFVRGVSGESARVVNPVTGERVTLYKTLLLDHLVRGNARSRGSEPVERLEQRWIMR